MKRCICNILCIVTKWNDQPLPKIVISVACLIHVCDMTHSYVWHVSFMCATWLIHMYDTTHSRVRPDSCRYDSYGTQCDMGIFPQKNDAFSKNQFSKNNQPLPRSAPIPWVCETWLIWCETWLVCHTVWPGSAKQRSHSMSLLAVMSPFFSVIHHTYVCM